MSATGRSAVRYVLLGALIVDGILVVGGIALAPEDVASLTGAGRIVADVALFVAIGAAAFFGPFALSRFVDVGDICLWTGAAFALVYGADLVLDFAGRSPIGVSPWWFFVAAALFASAWASYRTRRFTAGIAASAWALVVGTAIWSIAMLTTSYAFWRSAHGYAFWLRDGAVSDFHRSGEASLWPFLLQDIQGAIFFHPLLSVVLGVVCGTFGALAVLGAERTRAALRRPSKRAV
jgi:hypothetical protein